MDQASMSTTIRPSPGLAGYIIAGVTCAGLFAAGSAFGFAAGLSATRMSTVEANKTLPTQRVEVVVSVPTAAAIAASNGAIAAATPQQAEVLPSYSTQETLAGVLDHQRLGNANAPVQIVIFADPQCPFCKKMSDDTEKNLIAQYVDTGKAAITYRHFAFLGPESTLISQAMECAGQQGKFWDFHNYAFANQFPENSGLATVKEMSSWAKVTKLDSGKFKTCLDNPATKDIVDADQQIGKKLRVTGTPTLFVNGKPMPGALPYDMLKANIDGVLAK